LKAKKAVRLKPYLKEVMYSSYNSLGLFFFLSFSCIDSPSKQTNKQTNKQASKHKYKTDLGFELWNTFSLKDLCCWRIKQVSSGDMDETQYQMMQGKVAQLERLLAHVWNETSDYCSELNGGCLLL
jgi:hypothetical protein